MLKINKKHLIQISEITDSKVFFCNRCDNEKDNYCVFLVPVTDSDTPQNCPFGSHAKWERYER